MPITRGDGATCKERRSTFENKSVRTGTDWAFYLQKNATMICNQVSRKPKASRANSRMNGWAEVYSP